MTVKTFDEYEAAKSAVGFVVSTKRSRRRESPEEINLAMSLSELVGIIRPHGPAIETGSVAEFIRIAAALKLNPGLLVDEVARRIYITASL